MTEVKATLKNELVQGTVINGYRIEREIGRGAMAVVYLATQLDLGRPVAFKVLSSELSADTDFVTRFFNEARSAAALSHPNIIQAIDAGQTADGLYYFCMEYVDGETLLDILKRDGRIPAAKALEWFGQIADALNYGWELHKFTHGDIKPENIMINRQGQAKLADFGLARVDGHDYSGKVIMLTPLYAPPELIRGERFSEECRPDIYAFGASLYHALAGTPPFPGTDAQIVIQRHLTEELEPLSHRNMLIPKELSDFVAHMLVKDMAGRLNSWKTIMEGLKRLSGLVAASKRPLAFSRSTAASGGNARGASGGAARPKVSVPQKKGSGAWIFLVVLILLLGILACVLVLFMSRKGKAGPKEPLVYELGPDEKTKAPGQSAKLHVVQPPQSETPAAVPPPAVVEPVKADENPVGNAKENDVDAGDDEMEDSQAGKKPGQKNAEEQQGQGDDDGMADANEQEKEDDSAPEDHLLAYKLTQRQREFRAHAALALLWVEFSGQQTGQLNYRAINEKLKALTDEPWFTENQRKAAQFMRETLCAEFSKLPAYMNEHLSDIQKINVPLDRETWCIQDFSGSSDKLTAIVKVTKPGVSNQVPKDWMALHRKGVLAAICQKLIENGQKELPQDSVPLAYLAVGGFAREYDRMLRLYPTEKQQAQWDLPIQWEKFRIDQKAERTALALWGQIVAYADADSVEGVLAKGREIAEKCRNTRGYKTLQPTIGALMKKCKGLSAADKAKELLEKAQEELADKDNGGSDMFTPMMFWIARYGNEARSSVEGKNERLLAGAFGRLTDKKGGNHSPHILAVPFWLTDTSGYKLGNSPARVMYSLSRYKDEKRTEKIYKRLEELMMTLMRLEIGDWSYARKNYRQLQWKELDGLAKNELKDTGAALLASSTYGRAMLLTRYEGDTDSADKLMASLLKNARSLPNSVPAYSLVLEYWLLSRRGEYALSELPLPFAGKAILRHVTQEDRQVIQACNKRRFVYLYLAALFETGLKDEAVSLLKAIDKDKDAIVSKLNITEHYQRYFSELLSMHSEDAEERGREQKLVESHDAGCCMEYYKAKFSACGEYAIDGSADAKFKDIFSQWAPSARLIGGDVLFDWTLRRVAWELANGSLDKAAEIVQWTIEFEVPCLIPYYARLLALQAGLRLLAGRRDAIFDAPFIAERATAMSDRELKMFKCLADYPKVSEFKIKGTTRQQEYLWYQWMVACDQFADAGKESSEFDALQKRRSELALSERTLLTGLQKHVEER